MSIDVNDVKWGVGVVLLAVGGWLVTPGLAFILAAAGLMVPVIVDEWKGV